MKAGWSWSDEDELGLLPHSWLRSANAMSDNGLNNLDSTTGDEYAFFIDKMDENIKIKTT